MFDVGFAEIFLLGLIGLLVLGPERLPAVARTIGGFMRKARASWASLRSTIEAELAEADIANPIKEVGEEIKQIGKDLKPDMPDVNSILKPASSKTDSPDTGRETTESSETETEAEAGIEAETEAGIDARGDASAAEDKPVKKRATKAQSESKNPDKKAASEKPAKNLPFDPEL